MEGYLGETLVNIQLTKFKDFKPNDWAMYYIERYSQIDGAHHKQWCLDQIAQILKGTSIIVKVAKWDNGQEEYRVVLDEPSNQYREWVVAMCDGEDGPDTYSYDDGCAP